MRLQFIGADGSMGLRQGQDYEIHLTPWPGHPGGTLLLLPVRCPYATDAAFWDNWAVPEGYLFPRT
jgi:hypothetical protein